MPIAIFSEENNATYAGLGFNNLVDIYKVAADGRTITHLEPQVRPWAVERFGDCKDLYTAYSGVEGEDVEHMLEKSQRLSILGNTFYDDALTASQDTGFFKRQDQNQALISIVDDLLTNLRSISQRLSALERQTAEVPLKTTIRNRMEEIGEQLVLFRKVRDRLRLEGRMIAELNQLQARVDARGQEGRPIVDETVGAVVGAIIVGGIVLWFTGGILAPVIGAAAGGVVGFFAGDRFGRWRREWRELKENEDRHRISCWGVSLVGRDASLTVEEREAADAAATRHQRTCVML